jgi:glycosyltransferase involved in cell wall biosynthesis
LAHDPSRGLAVAERPKLHILALAERDWTHPQGGGAGENLFQHTSHWLEWGHRVTLVVSSYPGALPYEREGDLTIHRVARWATFFPRAGWRCWRGLVPDADVALEVINGVSFFTPIWMRTPRVTMIHHISKEQYVAEFGQKGRLPALALEAVPLRWVYRRSQFVTMSHASADSIAAHGIAHDQIRINNPGLDRTGLEPGEKSPEPTLLYLGRLKRYKRPEWALRVLEAIPEATLDIAGDGDCREELEAQIEERGLRDRVRLHGFVDEETKRRLLQRAWVHVMPSAVEGWALTVVEAAACGTPTVAANNGGLRESVQHERTGLLADDVPGLIAATRRLFDDPELRRVMGQNGVERARELSWERHARTTTEELQVAYARAHTPAATTPVWTTPRVATAFAANTLALAAAAIVSTGLIAGLAGVEVLLAVVVALASMRTLPDTPS